MFRSTAPLRLTAVSFTLALLLPLLAFVTCVERVHAQGIRYVDKYGARNCLGKTPCYQTIQAAVNAAQAGDTIYVFPATYNAGVDLSQMDPDGDITLATVDANGNPAPGTVTVDNPADAPEIYTGDPPFNGDVTIDGFVLRSEYGAIDLWVGSTTLAPSGAEGRLGPALVRDVEIRNVDASHTGEDGIVVRAEGDVTITDCVANDNQGLGINAFASWGDVTITGCTANDNHCTATDLGLAVPCYGIAAGSIGGQVTISDSTANRNGGTGIGVSGASGSQGLGPNSVATPDRVIIERCTASNNDGGGIWVRTVPGDVTITDCTTNGNGEDGVAVGGLLSSDEPGGVLAADGGDLTIRNCTSNGNGASGFDPEVVVGTVSIQACIARDNDQHGVDFDWWRMSETLLVNGSIICGNQCAISLIDIQETQESGGVSNGPTTMNFEGNWWGCPGGPEAAGCDPICQLDGLAVDFTPWIAKITDAVTLDPAVVGQPTEVSFQFSGNPSAVYLGKGPGDLRGPAPFAVSTDNGQLYGNGSTVHKFLGANGTLKVTLVPEREGTATVMVVGPCGIGELEGARAVVGVDAGFVPEPGTMLLLGSGLMGLAGYAGLRLRKR